MASKAEQWGMFKKFWFKTLQTKRDSFIKNFDQIKDRKFEKLAALMVFDSVFSRWVGIAWNSISQLESQSIIWPMALTYA